MPDDPEFLSFEPKLPEPGFDQPQVNELPKKRAGRGRPKKLPGAPKLTYKKSTEDRPNPYKMIRHIALRKLKNRMETVRKAVSDLAHEIEMLSK